MRPYSPPLSLWCLVEQHVSPHEQEEIKSMLGVSLVEQSQELHREIETLLDIWRDMRIEISENVSPQSILPEPPDQRDRLVQEICFFVNNVKEKAEEKGIDPQLILKRHNSQILDYAAELSTSPVSSVSRVSPSSADGRETPMIPSTYQRNNQSQETADKVQSVNKKLNYLEFGEVCESLRSTLEKEVEQLMEDIQFLQSCLVSEADSRDSFTPKLTSREPTLSELREERTHLEKDLMAANRITTIPQVVKPNFKTNNTVLPLTSPGSSESSSQKTQQVPLKADHNLIGAMGGESGRKSVLSDSNISRNVNVKVKTLNTLCQRGSSADKASAESSVRTDKKITVSKSSVILTGSSTLPVPPTMSSNKCDYDQSFKQLTGTQNSNKIRIHNQPSTSSTASVAKKDSAKVTKGVVRKRTVSPGRVRVVKVTTIVDTHSSRDDFSLPLTSSSTSSPVVSPPSSSSSMNTNSAVTLSSAHAERFRKMVLGCRDGD